MLLETGLNYVTGCLSVHSPQGNAHLKAQEPFYPGEESELEREIDRLEEMISFVEREPKRASQLMEALCISKDISGSIKRSF